MKKWLSVFVLLHLALAASAQDVFLDASDSVLSIGGHTVYHNPDGIVFYRAGMTIDCDGGPHCYHPQAGVGLDNTRNAGRTGHWWALATHDGTAQGTPLLQDSLDPAPGYYISMTSLADPALPQQDPCRYVNAEAVPYIVLPPAVSGSHNICKGDLALVINAQNGRQSWAVFADTGPAAHIGEGSVALAQALGVPDSPRTGGAEDHIWYFLFPGSSLGWPLTPQEWESLTATLLQTQPGLLPFLDSLR